MRVIKQSTLFGWGRKYPNADAGLRHWLKVTKSARWGTIQDARRTFGHADPVPVASGNTVTVFNVGSYRLAAAVKYRWQTVYLLRFMTHADYDKGIAKKADGKPGKWRDEL